MAISTIYRYVLKCKRCESELIAPQSVCQKCGGIRSAIFVKNNAKTSSNCICAVCNKEIIQKPIPKNCILCGSVEKNWWDTQLQEWAQPEIKLNLKLKGIWLTGDFSGDFLGSLKQKNLPKDPKLLEHYPRNYDVRIVEGILKNYSFSSSPPDLVFSSNPSPIRQKSSTSILVKDPTSESYFPINLVDLIIFEWHKVADKEFLDEKKIAGHLVGKLCACLVTSDVTDEAINSMEDESSELSSSLFDIGIDEADKPSIQNIQDSSRDKVSIKPADTPKVNFDASIQSFPHEDLNEKKLDSEIETLLDQSAGVTSRGEKLLAATPSSLDGNKLVEKLSKEQDKNDSKVASPERNCLVCNWLFQLIFSIIFFFWLPGDSLQSDFGRSFLCHSLQSLVFILALKLTCLLKRLVGENKLQIKAEKIRHQAKVVIIAISLICLVITMANKANLDCFQLSSIYIWLLLSLICLLLSTFLRNCLTTLTLSISFAFTILFTINCNDKQCDSNKSSGMKNESIISQVENVKIKADELVITHKANKIEEKAKSVAGSDYKNKRVTINDLSNDPNAIVDCITSIYLGELGLFDRNSATIKESGEEKLELLTNWMKTESPNKNYIITGHADQTGEFLPNGLPNAIGYATNMRLSKQRAEAVGKWLIDHNAVNGEQLVIRGVGSSEPLTTDPDKELQKMNIRVELKVNCQGEE